ncbi:abortive infection family protein, partial [Pseudomonas viridiflava]
MRDSHGTGKAGVKPAPRHAELAVNLAGSLALYLLSTWDARST